ncbi:MAG TPA: Lsr2 family protein [Jatrophihabitantaceae bacterium]|jgi:hypothetical protein|nr:Lsr2 family protein [Jatrophihabitantaceae bacterium]
MAQRHIVQLVDDLDGSEATETVSFAIDGSSYEIDLSSKNAAALRDAVALYVASGRRTTRSSSSGRRRRGAPGSDREQLQAIREWARSNGHNVGSKGRIPSAILEAYHAQN